MRQHLRALLKAAASQCPSLAYGIVGEALGLLMKTYDEESHLEALNRLQVQQLLMLRAGHMPRGAEGLDVHERLWWHGTSMGP